MANKKINISIDKVYTKKGDKGTTDIIGDKNVPKSDPRVSCYGEVDELNSCIGFCLSLIEDCDILRSQNMVKSIKIIQNDLFNLGTMLSTSEDFDKEHLPSISNKNVEYLEKLIDSYNEELMPLKSFVLPSGSKVGSYFHVCRTVCRRVERRCVALSSNYEVHNDIISYLNRLSDLLFVWARWANKKLGKKENLWLM